MSLAAVFRTAGRELPQVSICQRVSSFRTGCHLLAAEKALLMKLRKETGYTFINCKRALEMFENDVTKAKNWLHEQAQKEGWSKANKLQGRKAKEGLIGLFVGDKAAVMVEVNCETDFVARNEKFQKLVKNAAFATLTHHGTKTRDHPGYVKSMLGADELTKLSVGEGTSLADEVALTIGSLGENMSVRRAVTVGVPAGWRIGSYVHGGLTSQTDMAMGRYGALVVFQGGKEGDQEALGRKLGQHVVGEAPLSLGNVDDLPCGDSETRLLPQNFLPDPSLTVAQFLRGQQAKVLDFVRFQCGETFSEGTE
ncbi:elongation factor Ts, mitochondrial [Lampris incognitus]|uniref:elongation factor Ts, mitochondrial n=1 Tax=Lampris incognitus TaxID=2546036 RepID=UPI0024B483AF|nr:elongation factor Ts, mitochondrial [Lampris incognitus]